MNTFSVFSNEKLDFINKNFHGDIYEIFNKLETITNQGSLLNKLQSKCPISLAVTAKLIKNSNNKTLKECLELEYRLSQKMTNRNDFGEGINAFLIEKHHNPKWQPSSIKEINQRELENLFVSNIDNELVL